MPRTRSRSRRDYFRGMSGPSGVPDLPLPNWWLRGDGLDIEVGPQWANQWVSINGPTLEKDPNYRMYNLGPLANGQQGALCTSSGGRMVANDTCAPNSPDYTFIAVIDPDNDTGCGMAEFFLDLSSGNEYPSINIIFAQQADQSSYVNAGVYHGPINQWLEFVTPLPYRHTYAVTYHNATGTAKFYRFGALVATVTGLADWGAPSYANPALGAKWFADLTQISNWFKGTIYEVKLWSGIVASAAQIAVQSAQLDAYYANVVPAWDSTASPDPTCLLDARGKFRDLDGIYTGEKLYKWLDQSSAGSKFESGGGNVPAEVLDRRINGRVAASFDGVGQFLTGQDMPSYTDGARYEYYLVFIMYDVSGSFVTPADSSQILGADNGRFFTGLRDTGAGTFEIYCGHDDGTGDKYALLTGLTYGTPYIVHAWFDNDRVYAQANDGTVEQSDVATAVPSVGGPMYLGLGTNHTKFTNMCLSELHFHSSKLTPTERAQKKEFLEAKYLIPVGT